MKYYVIHYTKNDERRRELCEQLKEYNIEPEWIEIYDREDPIIEKIKLFTNSPLSLKDISCNMKHYEAMKKMVEDDVDEAIILEDDVIFFPEFRDIHPYHASGLLRLGLGVGAGEPHRPPPSSTRVFITSNPGGSEATWITKKFAETAIQNLNFDNSIDHIQYAILLNFFGQEMRCMNTCFQTSLDLSPSQFKVTEWKTFCEKFKTYKRYNFNDLVAIVSNK